MFDKKITMEELREIGWTIWNPIGLDKEWRSSAPDEYDRYLIAALGRLQRSATVAEVAEYLAVIEAEHMGSGEANYKRAQLTAEAIKSRLVDPLEGKKPSGIVI